VAYLPSFLVGSIVAPISHDKVVACWNWLEKRLLSWKEAVWPNLFGNKVAHSSKLLVSFNVCKYGTLVGVVALSCAPQTVGHASESYEVAVHEAESAAARCELLRSQIRSLEWVTPIEASGGNASLILGQNTFQTTGIRGDGPHTAWFREMRQGTVKELETAEETRQFWEERVYQLSHVSMDPH
jgi:hypothetical protein